MAPCEFCVSEPIMAETIMDAAKPADPAKRSNDRWPLLARMAIIFGGAGAMWAGVFILMRLLR